MPITEPYDPQHPVRLGVDQSDAVVEVEAEHALLDAGQHRLAVVAVLRQPRVLLRLGHRRVVQVHAVVFLAVGDVLTGEEDEGVQHLVDHRHRHRHHERRAVAQPGSDPLGDVNAAVSPAGTAEGDRDIGLSLRSVAREEHEQRRAAHSRTSCRPPRSGASPAAPMLSAGMAASMHAMPPSSTSMSTP